MDKQVLIIFGLVSLFINVSESRMIVPRGLSEDESSGNGEMSMDPSEKNRKLGLGPGIFDPLGGAGDLGGYDYDSGVNKPQRPPTDNDFHKTEEDRFPSGEDRLEPPLKKPTDNDEEVDKKYDEENPSEEEDDSNKDDSLPSEENGDKPIHADGDDSNAGEETDKEEGNDEESEEKEGEDDDKKDHVPDADDDENKLPEDENEEPEEHDEDEKPFDGEEAGFVDSDGSIFDTPFFNLEQVKKYFGTLDRALGQVFRQTLDEARLLNGTYANTTEEEVEIDGKKYIVQKSVIQGADNHSSIYVEALSSKPKLNDTEEMKSTEATNSTEV